MTTDQSTYWVSIGRNVGDTPLSHDDWQTFHRDVRDTIHECHGTILSTVRGTSEWEGTNEDCVLILATFPTPVYVASVRAILASLARHWQQDAIGLVGGSGESLIFA